MIKKNEFSKWLEDRCNLNARKLVTDNVSRAAKVEEQLKLQYGESFSFEDQFAADRGQSVLALFDHKGLNDKAAELKPGVLPIGTMQMYPLKSAVRRYFDFLAD